MSIENAEDLEGLWRVGRIVRLALRAMAREVRAGVSTAGLEEIGARVMRENGARSAPRMVYGFPGEVLISLNEEAVHGIPSHSRTIRAGDLVKLDVTFEKDGYMADAASTIPVEPVTEQARALVECARRAFGKALAVARARHRVHEIGRAVEREARQSGFRVIRELGGHGIGRTIHEEPHVPNFDDPCALEPLREGMVLTIEPILSAGCGRVRQGADGWTLKTLDGSLSAHYEQTLVIQRGAPIVLTAASSDEMAGNGPGAARWLT